MTEPSSPGPDLRLFGVAGGMWLASLVALYGTVAVAVWLALAGAALAAGLGLFLRSLSRRGARRPGSRTSTVDSRTRVTVVGWIAVAIALGVVSGALSTGARTVSRDAQPLAALAAQHAAVRIEVTVTDDPRALRTSGIGPVTYLVAARLTRLDVTDLGTVRLDVRVIIFSTEPGWRALLPSQRVASSGRLAPPGGGDLTAATVNATGAPEILAGPSRIQRAAGRLRAGLQAACLPLAPDPGGLLPGLVIGDTSRLDKALAEDFRTTGLTHLVAVSGANLAILLGVVLFAARWCRAGPWLAAAICAFALAGFVILARPSPSVVRAAAMGAIGLLALASGRSRSAAPALAAAAMVGLVVDPALATDAGFALSVAATGALVLLAPGWSEALRRRGVPRGLAEALAIPAAAQVVCGPIVVALSGQVSLVAIPANLLAAPAVAPATLLGIAAAVVSPLWSDAAGWLAWLASWPAQWLVWLARTGAGVPVGAVPWPAGLVGAVLLTAVTVGLVLAARRPVARRLILVAALAIAAGAVPVRWLASGWPPAGAVVIACDVGQGDAIVLPTAAHEAVVVDAGPDPIAMDGCLRRLGITVVPVLVITHFHVDHMAGVSGVVRDRAVGEFVIPRYTEPESGRRVVAEAATAAGVALTTVDVGWSFARGDMRLQVIGPAQIMTGTRSDPNNNSLLLFVVNHGVSVLLVGDAEFEEQDALLRDAGPSIRGVDVLKVAHHGSLYQDPALLDAAEPIVALVSVGAANPYGHPNPAVLDRLTRHGARVLRTDRDGDVAVLARDGGVAVAVRGGEAHQ